MLLFKPRIAVAFLAGLMALAVAACGAQPTRWDEAQDKTRGKKAVSTDAYEGSVFNKFFPKAESPFDLVYKQEKKGTAIADLKQDGKPVATLTIFDTVSNPDAITDYKESTQALAGFPLVAKGAKGTALLVNRRFQVQVRSTDDAFTEEDRKTWLKKFDLDGLAQLN
ncbi:MAG: hypothetical protein JNM56_11485 [Planctomycetia bacterium]|nr:hypothetical protein [Planctomycetia bacterium]